VGRRREEGGGMEEKSGGRAERGGGAEGEAGEARKEKAGIPAGISPGALGRGGKSFIMSKLCLELTAIREVVYPGKV